MTVTVTVIDPVLLGVKVEDGDTEELGDAVLENVEVGVTVGE